MTILARYTPKNEKVEIQDVFECGGVKLVCIRALDGKPFIGGDKWPVATPYATVPASDLAPIEESAQPVNLLSLSLAAAKPAWYSGESVWLVGNGKNGKGAYLKNVGGWIMLFCLGPYSKGLPVFYFDPSANAWVESQQLRKNYQAWAAEVKQALEPKPAPCPVCHGRGKIFTVIGEGMGRNGKYNKWRFDPCPRCGRIEVEKAEATQ